MYPSKCRRALGDAVFLAWLTVWPSTECSEKRIMERCAANKDTRLFLSPALIFIGRLVYAEIIYLPTFLALISELGVGGKGFLVMLDSGLVGVVCRACCEWLQCLCSHIV